MQATGCIPRLPLHVQNTMLSLATRSFRGASPICNHIHACIDLDTPHGTSLRDMRMRIYGLLTLAAETTHSPSALLSLHALLFPAATRVSYAETPTHMRCPTP